AQFALLVLVNGFVGAVVGVERSVLPLLAEAKFGVASATATLSFLVAFGLAKAVANLLAGEFADRVGRRRILIAGWLLGLPVPFLLMWAPSWDWIVFANLLLGANQGLAWSATVIMKIDLVGPRQRGLAMGLNEFVGYVAVALAALGAGYLAAAYGPGVAPFWIAGVAVVLGLLVTLLFVRDTDAHVALEASGAESARAAVLPDGPVRRFLHSSWTDPQLRAVNQAGLVNNLNDAVAWGLLPLFFATHGLSTVQIGWLAALYPGVWGVSQIAAGALSDRAGRDHLIAGGMLMQAAALMLVALGTGFWIWAVGAVLLGLGTAAVYPTLIARVADRVVVSDRAAAVGAYRLWRDLGYVAGGLLAGVVADLAGLRGAVFAVAVLTAASGVVAWRLLGTEHINEDEPCWTC
ncbi:MAG TPA: MFS transporter, partial [Planctomycetaceae bacterium]|nr:MFS transporter [Planctomycetaceae bacterium]